MVEDISYRVSRDVNLCSIYPLLRMCREEIFDSA